MMSFLLMMTGLLTSDEPAPPSIWQTVVTRKLTEVQLPPAVLGVGWQPSPGIRVNDLSNLEAIGAPERASVEPLAKQLVPLGVRSVGDYSLVTSSSPLNMVTVRVYVFTSVDQCRSWWAKKYQGQGWEKLYKVVASERFVAVDSRETNKRALAFGNVWLTAHQLGKGDEHLKALTAVVESLTAPK